MNHEVDVPPPSRVQLDASSVPLDPAQLASALGERIKELNCLYSLSRLIETPGISLSEILQGTVELLPAGWQYPEIACARLIWQARIFQTSNYLHTPWKQTRAILVQGEPVGEIEVAYLETPGGDAQTPFLAEEAILIKAVAERLGHVIQREEAVARLRSSEAQLQAITQSAQDGIVMMDREGCISFWNPAAERMFGYKSDEVLGRNLHEILAPERYHDAHVSAFPFFKERGEGDVVNKVLELQAVRKNLEEFPIELSLGGIRFEDGWHAVGIIRDITRRKRAEHALAEREQRYRAFFEQGPDGVVIVEPESGRILEFNDWACRQLGYSRDEMATLKIADIEVLENNAQVLDHIKEIQKSGFERFDSKHRARDGRIVDVSITAQILEIDSRAVFHCIWRDITERKRVEEELRVSNARLDALWSLSTIRSANPDTISEYILTTIGKMTNSPFCFLATHRASSASVEIRCYPSLAERAADDADFSLVLPMAEAGFWAEAISGRAPIILDPCCITYPGVPQSAEATPWIIRLLAMPFQLAGNTDSIAVVANRSTAYGDDDIMQLRSFLAGIQGIAEARQSEEALRLSEQRMRALVESANDWIWELDSKGRYCYASPHCREILGYEPEEVIGKTPFDFMDPEEAARVRPLFEILASELRTFHRLPNRARHRDGHEVVLETNGVPILDSAGNYCGYRGVDQDITARQKAEGELRVNQERHRDILMTSMEGYWLVDEAGRLVEVNESYCQMSGYAKEELLQLGIPDIDVAMSQQDIETRMAQILRQGSARFETRHRRKDGSVFDVEVCVQHRASQGQIVSFLRDITDRKRMELVMSARLRLLQKSTTDSLADLLRSTLDEAEALTGSQVGFYHFVDPDQLSLTLQAWSTNTVEKMCNAEGAGAHYPINEAGVWVDCVKERKPLIHNDYAALTHKKGLPKGHAPVLRELVVPVFRGETIVALLGVGNKPTHYDEHDVEMVHSLADWAWDIAERKRAEEERAAMQKQLLQSQKMEAIGHLAGGVAHDFNNLLQVILVNTDLAMSTLDPGSEAWKELDEVNKATCRASDLTRQLLAFSRRQVMKPVSLDLNELAQGVVKMLRRLIGEHIELCIISSESLGTVFADKGQIEQVVMNLCVNARDAMPHGGRITIETSNEVLDVDFCRQHPWARPGSYVQLSVTDTGVGMDALTLARVFEPFFTTKESGKGTGLGLASVHGIVSQHSGLIHVYSEFGTGSVFKVYLPAIAAAHVEAPFSVSMDIVGGSETNLVAEDEPAILKMLHVVLQAAGYTVLTAADGREALRVFETHADSINLVILDVMMPGLSGKAVMQEILARGRSLPFLFSSGYSENVLHTDFVIQEGLHLIQKPYGKDKLLLTVRQVLDSWKGSTSIKTVSD